MEGQTNPLLKSPSSKVGGTTMSLVKVVLKVQTLVISEICQYICSLVEKICKSFSHFFNKKYKCVLL